MEVSHSIGTIAPADNQSGLPNDLIPMSLAARFKTGTMALAPVSRWYTKCATHILNPTGTSAITKLLVSFFHGTEEPPRDRDRAPQQAATTAGTTNKPTANKNVTTGSEEVTPNVLCSCCSQACTGATIPAAFTKAPATNNSAIAATSGRRASRPNEVRTRSGISCVPGEIEIRPIF